MLTLIKIFMFVFMLLLLSACNCPKPKQAPLCTVDSIHVNNDTITVYYNHTTKTFVKHTGSYGSGYSTNYGTALKRSAK